jgi:hypothetical protein
MKIKIKTGEKLSQLLDALANEIVFSQIYYRLLCDLAKARASHEIEFSNFITFWTHTLGSTGRQFDEIGTKGVLRRKLAG